MKGKIQLGSSEAGPVTLGLSALKKHFISIGSTGSGKTVLSKVIIEEAALNGIPSIIVDPHGDLASLAIPAAKKAVIDNGLSQEDAEKLRRFPVNIFTPESKAGIPLSVSPLEIKEWSNADEKIGIVDHVASAMTSLLGYDLSSDKGASTKGILYTVLMERQFTRFQELAQYLEDKRTMKKLEHLLSSESQLKEISRKLNLLTIGKAAQLFESGYRLNIGDIIAKPSINVIYLNSLTSQEEKDFFVSILVKDLYEWMLHHPSKDLQLLFLIDEIAPFIPAGALKPASKEILKILFKQSRKYGVGCLVATQNPGDIDYMAFSQFGSWAIGRLTTRQDQKKVEEALESISTEDISAILPTLLPGNFLLFSPDSFASVTRFKSRWLYSEHQALTEADIARLMAGRKPSYSPSPREITPAAKPEIRQGKEILPLNVTDSAAYIQKSIRKTILGKPEEQLLSTRLELIPVYRLKTRHITRVLGVRVGARYNTVLVSASNGNILTPKLSEANLGLLYRLTEDQLIAYAAISQKGRISTEELAYRMKVPASQARKHLGSLQGQKIISYIKEGHNQMWYLVKELPLESIGRYDCGSVKTQNYTGNATLMKAKISEDDITRIIKIWYSSDVTDSSLIYLPVYRIVLQSKTGERTIRFSAVTGTVL